MSTTEKVCFSVFVLMASALAQNQLRTGPSPAATGPAYDVSVGYTNLAMSLPGAGRVNLNGLDVSGSVGFKPRWGATLDSNYARTSKILGTPHGGYLLSFLGGPVFYPVEHGDTRVFVHALAGTYLVDGATPIHGTLYRYGWLGGFSYALGGGVEHPVAGPFSVRVGADYLHTSFFDSAGAVLPQGNFRLTGSLVFRLNERQHTRTYR